MPAVIRGYVNRLDDPWLDLTPHDLDKHDHETR